MAEFLTQKNRGKARFGIDLKISTASVGKKNKSQEDDRKIIGRSGHATKKNDGGEFSTMTSTTQ